MDQSAPPAAGRIAGKDWLAGVARGQLFTSVDCFGYGRRPAGAQSEVATATGIRDLPIAFAPRRRAKRILRALQPDAGTLPTGTDEHGALLVHCLDIGQPVAANLAAEERLFIRAVGGE